MSTIYPKMFQCNLIYLFHQCDAYVSKWSDRLNQLGYERIRKPRMMPVFFFDFRIVCLFSNRSLQRLQHIYKNFPEIGEWWKTRFWIPLSNLVSQLRHVFPIAQSRNCSGDRGFIGVLRREISSIRFLSLSRCSKNLSIVSGPVYTNIPPLNSGNADTVKHDTPDGTWFLIFFKVVV